MNQKRQIRMHAMIKPYGPVCNLDCDYCYYLSKLDLLKTDSSWKMDDKLLEEFIEAYIDQQDCDAVVFSWQGGESSLRGLDFFRKVTAIQKRCVKPGMRIENDLQTNGTTLTDQWCRFLKEENFLVGLSIDGPGHIHDKYRRGADGKGSFVKVLNAAKKLRRYGVNFATLTVVNNMNARRPLETYRFLRDTVGSQQMQFIPIVEPRGFQNTAPQYWDEASMVGKDDPRTDPAHPDSVVEPWCVESQAYGDFLTAVFDEWYASDYGKIFVPFFDSAVEQWMGRPSPLCIFSPICGKGLALEHDGGVYSCDHYVYPEYQLGNINDQPLSEMAFSQRQQDFGYSKDGSLPLDCRVCPYLFACSGECPKNRFLLSDSGQPGLNYLCKGLLSYFRHINPYIQRIVRRAGYGVCRDAPPVTA